MLVQAYSPVAVTQILHNAAHADASQVDPDSRNISVKARVRQDNHHDREGKRWVRRRDNSRFVGNAHIVKPSIKDFGLSLSIPRPTFPKPLPSFIARHLSAPSALPPLRNPASANAGRYSLSLKGVRRDLRRSGPRAEQIVLDIEQELMDWLESGGILISPDSQDPELSATPGTPIGSSNSIIEVHRSPTELIWRIDEDFPRFLLHCVARFHAVVSFSKTVSGAERDMRLTHLLRPNVTRPDFMAPGVLDTPPESDADALSVMVDTEDSDVASEIAVGLEAGVLAHSPLVCSNSLLEEDRPSSFAFREQPSFDDADSSVDQHDDTLSISVEPLTREAEKRDWESLPGSQSPRAVSSSSCFPLYPVRRSTPQIPNSQESAKNCLPFWQYVFA